MQDLGVLGHTREGTLSFRMLDGNEQPQGWQGNGTITWTPAGGAVATGNVG